ncbi:MAG: GNAT family N-acetyltransferase [Tenericutes bacterium]|nr:GNAT family N-acetyltransferase [Mycoplasmatota bacterium]
MIRLLKEEDRTSVLEYLYQDVNYNIFPIGDIEVFGFDTDFQRIYAEFDEDNNYLSIFLRYRENAVYYSHKRYFNEAYAEILKKDSFDFFSCKTELMDLINVHLPKGIRNQMYFCRAKEIKHDIDYDNSIIKRLKTKEECEKLYDFLKQIKEFGVYKQSKENFVKSKLKSLQMGTTLYIEKDNRIISTVATTADTTKNAMVVAVATDNNCRKRGYASFLLLSLMKEYINGLHKELCLFYDNPEAGKIYLKLGFENIGTWDMYSVSK